ncbi:unnamed protein product [Lathyrus sativus]|nr:unnamed protein product [Lathyrus sativus]
MLSYAGRLQLVRSVIFFISNYWMQIFPLLKKVVARVEGLCRRFLWTGADERSRKALISWDHVCDPVSASERNMVSLVDWNKATIGKMLWNIWSKKAILWSRWLHTYYMKQVDVKDFNPGQNFSWIIKAIFKSMNMMTNSEVWQKFR